MEFKYPEYLRFKIAETRGIKSQWKFPKAGSCSDDCEHKGDLKVGEEAVLRHKRMSPNSLYYLNFDSGLESDYLSEREVEILMGKGFMDQVEANKITYEHVVQPKPPLGVMSKDIYEFKRVQDLCRALYERSIFEEVDYELMIRWSDELNDRLYGLKEGGEYQY